MVGRIGWWGIGILALLLIGCGGGTLEETIQYPPKAPRIHLNDPAIPDDEWGPDALPNGIHIEWDANEEPDLEGYRVYRALSSDGPFEFLAEVPKSQTFYDDLAVQRELRYYYRVTAFNRENLESPMSEIVAYTLLPVAVPVRPRNHAVLSDPEPIFDWLPVGGAAWYVIRVEVSTDDPQQPWRPVWVSDPIFSFDHFEIPYNQDDKAVERLEPGKEYRWRVDVVGDRTVGSESEWQYFTLENP